MHNASTNASRTVYRIAFGMNADIDRAEEMLLLAILAIGCLHGDAAVRLDARYAIDHRRSTFVVDASTEIGHAVTKVFIGFCAHELGHDAFVVARPVDVRRSPVAA